MQKHLLPLTLAGLVCCAPVHANDITRYVDESRALAQQFGSTLKQELQQGIQAGGPAHAIGVCNARAPAIADELGRESGWEVGRTSLRIRNPGNLPDAWEKHILETFEERLIAGEQAGEIEHFEVVQEGEEKVFRYMKAIPTAEVCVSCHGSVVDSSVRDRLRVLYPMDKARGYRPGDIRGAFTFARTLSAEAGKTHLFEPAED